MPLPSHRRYLLLALVFAAVRAILAVAPHDAAADFEARVEQGNAIVLDIRDLRQRDVALFPFKEERAQLDDRDKIAEVVARAKKADKPLLIYDKVGKQAPWFRYYLEREGVKRYFFMEGGAEGYHEAKFGELTCRRSTPERSIPCTATRAGGRAVCTPGPTDAILRRNAGAHPLGAG